MSDEQLAEALARWQALVEQHQVELEMQRTHVLAGAGRSPGAALADEPITMMLLAATAFSRHPDEKNAPGAHRLDQFHASTLLSLTQRSEMREADQSRRERRDVDRMADEIEQLRIALEASEEKVTRLGEDRDRLLRRVAEQARELQAANAAYARVRAARIGDLGDEDIIRLAAGGEQEELRVAFEEMQVLTEELEVANNSLHETNRALDERVAERTRELERQKVALTESELRFRTLVEGIPQLVWRAVGGGRWTWASPQWFAYTGLGREESLGHGWLSAIHPEDREHAEQCWRRAEAGAPLAFEARLLHAGGGRHRHFQMRAIATHDESGEMIEWLGTSTDIDDLLRLQQRQQLLVAELEHRVRNILTVIRSVFGRTVEASGEIGDLADHFRGRLDSLARTQVVVTQSAGGMVDLENLIRDELLSVGVSDGPKVEIKGPDVALTPTTAESIGLAIHELTINALKYGALKVAGATLHIHWETDPGESGDRRVNLTWVERGVPAVVLEPARRGFGSELITEALPYRLGAETKLKFRGGGVRCTISLPLRDEAGTVSTAWRL